MSHQKETLIVAPAVEEPETAKKEDNTLPIVAMVLGLVSLTGPGLVLGIPAIVIAAIALKKKRGNQGMSITGLISGIVSTVISLFVIILLLILIVSNLNNPANPIHRAHPGTSYGQQQNDSSYDTQSY